MRRRVLGLRDEVSLFGFRNDTVVHEVSTLGQSDPRTEDGRGEDPRGIGTTLGRQGLIRSTT